MTPHDRPIGIQDDALRGDWLGGVMDDFMDGVESAICYTVTTLLFLIPIIVTIWIVLAWDT